MYYSTLQIYTLNRAVKSLTSHILDTVQDLTQLIYTNINQKYFHKQLLHIGLIETYLFEMIEEQSSQTEEDQADLFFKNSQYQNAIHLYHKIIKSNPKKDYQIDGLGNIDEAEGYYRWDTYNWYNQQKYNSIIKGSPYDALSLCYSICEDLYMQGLNWYRSMLVHWPDNYQLVHGYANLLNNNSQYDEAVRRYNQVLQLKPTLIKAEVALAFIYFIRLNNEFKTYYWIDRILQKDQRNMFALLINAKCKSDKEKSIQMLNELFINNPKYIRVLFQLGNTEQQKGQQDQKVIQIFKKCCQMAPKFIFALNKLGTYYLAKSKYRLAKKYLFQSILEDDDFIDSYKYLKLFYDQVNNSNRQIQNDIKRYGIRSDRFYNNLGQAYFEASDLIKATMFLQKAEQKHKNYKDDNQLSTTFRILADTYKQTDMNRMAIQYLQKSLVLNSKNVQTYYLMGAVYLKTQKMQSKAFQCFRTCLKIDPLYQNAFLGMGRCLIKQNKIGRAIKQLRQSAHYNSKHLQTYAQLANCYLRRCDYKQANRYCYKIQEIINEEYLDLDQIQSQLVKNIIYKYRKRIRGIGDNKMKNKINWLKNKYNLKFKYLFQEKEKQSKNQNSKKIKKNRKNKISQHIK